MMILHKKSQSFIKSLIKLIQDVPARKQKGEQSEKTPLRANLWSSSLLTFCSTFLDPRVRQEEGGQDALASDHLHL
jgi:hypothetical protein